MGRQELRLEHLLEPWMVAATLLLVPVLVAPVAFELSPVALRALELVKVFVWLMFYGEMFAKLAVSVDRLRTLRRNWLLIIILASPLLVPLRVIRIVRLVSIMRVLRLQSALRYMKPRMQKLVLSFEETILVVGIFVLCAGFLMWQVELKNGGAITTYDDAMWWAIITITTVGYGDIVPATIEGKVIGAVVSLVGIVMFMVLVARATAYFVEYREMQMIERHLKHIEAELQD